MSTHAITTGRVSRFDIRVVLAAVFVALLVGALWAVRFQAGQAQHPAASSGLTAASVDWLPPVDAAGSPLDVGASERMVVLKTASWCLPCGGAGGLADVQRQAAARPQTTFVVMLVRETDESARAMAATVSSASNIRVVQGELSTGVTQVSKAFGAGLPAMAILEGGAVTSSGSGVDDVKMLSAAG